VALSRVKSLEGLYLTSYDPKKIRINKKVQEFYQQISEPNVIKEEAKEGPKEEAKEGPKEEAKEQPNETKTIKLFNLSEYEYKNK
jgi:hypothetical protein